MFQKTLPFFILLVFSFFSEKKIHAQTDFSASPYIMYWGHFEGKFVWNADNDQYEAAAQVTPSDFRLSVQREPRLWTGSTILKSLKFKIEDIAVVTDEAQEAMYLQSRVALDRLAVRADKGITYTVLLSFPDGKKGRFVIDFLVKDVPAEEKEFWQKSGLMKESVWGKPLATLSEQREFVSQKELTQCVTHWIEYMKLLPLTSDKAAYVSVVPPVRPAYEIEVPRKIHSDSLAQARLHKQLSAEHIEPGTQIFFQVRPVDAWVGDFLLFYVVREDDPLLGRHKYDRRLFGFEWGNFRYELKGYYGDGMLLRDGSRKAVDAAYKQEERSLDAAQIKQLLDLEMRVWEKGAALSQLRYTLSAGSAKYEFHAGSAIPPMVRAQFDAAIDNGASLTISAFEAENMDLRNLSIIFYPKK